MKEKCCHLCNKRGWYFRRGLCYSCYERLRQRVKEGLITWDQLKKARIAT